MIRENQRLLNQLNVLSDGLIVFLALPAAFWLRFYLLPGGVISVPFRTYLVLSLVFTLMHLFCYAAWGLYGSFRRTRLYKELTKLVLINLVLVLLLLSYLFLRHNEHFSRLAIGFYFLLTTGLLGGKRIVLRTTLRRMRQKGFNQKHILILGGGEMAKRYLQAICTQRDLGYQAMGYVAERTSSQMPGLPYLGTFGKLDEILKKRHPDEVISAIDMEDYLRTPQIIAACEKAGVKLSIIPFYADFMPSNPQFDDVGGIPLMNIRRVPLENWANAFVKRCMDVVGSLLLILLSSPVMLVCAIGVKLSSPGPIIFCQQRVGLNKKTFNMYKFRSMRVNTAQDTAWSSDHDSRKTRFGAFLRKFSLDEFPQFFNVLKGDMSLVGPRPEIPYYVEQFQDQIPRYMIKHLVRPGITGWAQVNGFRGDTSIEARIEHDIYYIEHWSILLDIRILFQTVFGGKFVNSEALKG